MNKLLTLIISLLFANLMFSQTPSIYDFKVKTIDGDTFDFATVRGKKVLIVNTASECGLTPQYKQLQELHEKYGSEKFLIIGFPANNFMGQEPGTNAEIKSFCQKNFGVGFLMMEKISVKGDDMHPIFKWLTRKELNGVEDAEVKWNFQKFIIDESGKWAGTFSPKTDPLNNDIVNWIKTAAK